MEELSEGICRLYQREKKKKRGKEKREKRVTLIPEGIEADIRVNQFELVF